MGSGRGGRGAWVVGVVWEGHGWWEGCGLECDIKEIFKCLYV